MPRILGITGNIACGKSAVGEMLVAAGIERYIDADALVHQLYAPGQVIARAVGEVFGVQVLALDGSVDRQLLGSIVFQDAAALKRLEEIVHPAVSAAVRDALSSVSDDGIAVLDAVKLLEGGSARLCQSIWLIVCDPELQRRRLMQRNHLTAAEAQARLARQPDVQARLPYVDEVIDNSGTLDETRQQVVTALERFTAKFPDSSLRPHK